MIVLMNDGIAADDPRVRAVCAKARFHRVVPTVHKEQGTHYGVVEVYFKDTPEQRCSAVPNYPFQSMQGVKEVIRVSPAQVSLRSNGGQREPRRIQIGSDQIGQGLPCVPVFGPCTVDRHVDAILRGLKENGIKHVRGGGRKPRSNAKGFRGFGSKGWRWLMQAAKEYSMESVWTEVMESQDVDTVRAIRDEIKFPGDLVLWVGARNTGSYRLLERLGACRDVVAMIKNGLYEHDVDALFTRAEFVVSGPMYWDEDGVLDEKRSRESGNDQLILCVRGLENRDPHSRLRFYPNYEWIAAIHERSWAPVCFDPSHIAGDSERVFPVLHEALEYCPDVVMVEVHSDPAKALCDKDQAVRMEDVPRLLSMIRMGNERRQPERLLAQNEAAG